MSIYGVGIDIVDVGRFRSAMERWGRRFTGRLFTGAELAYCLARKDPAPHLAARFAAKVSFFKATGLPLRFRDVEVASSGGRPVINFVGEGWLRDGFAVTASVAHDAGLSMAQTIVERVET